LEKRVVVFLIVSLAIILAWDFLLKQFGLAPPPPTEQASQGVSPSPAPAPDTEPGAPRQEEVPAGGSKEEARPGPERSEATRVRAAALDETHEVVTDLFRAVFTNRGAEIQSWELTRYRTAGEHPTPVQLMHSGGKFRKPLSVQVADPVLGKTLSEALYEVERDFRALDASHPTGHLTFRYAAPALGLRIEKHLTFHYQSYLVDVEVKAEGLTGGFDLGLGTNFGIVEWGEGFIGLIGPASIVDEKLEKNTPDNEVERKGAVRWVALQDKYFMSVLIPSGATAAVITKEGDKLVSARARFAGTGGPPTAALRLYAGPKEYDTLRALGLGLEDTIDFGWFIYGSWDIVRALAKPLFYVLRFLHEYTRNYGISIILLTIGIKLLFVPLQYKGYKSMKDMQVVQPKVAALQEKYKDDRERLNKEMIKLYRDHKVNPVGGCLPMFLQTPVFVALFNILYMTIDLRQAPFILWITDLSVQDPYYVLPIVMGASMVVQQKIMPTTMDPTQAKIMLFLPAFMTILFITFPAGLVLYWLTNNVLTITQQFVTDRYIFKRPTFTSAPAEPAAPAEGADGAKPAGKKKSKAEAESRVES
jgi:YidC/Oxa1 family membrane protein insertase